MKNVLGKIVATKNYNEHFNFNTFRSKNIWNFITQEIQILSQNFSSYFVTYSRTSSNKTVFTNVKDRTLT